MKYILILSLFLANLFYSQKADVKNVLVNDNFKCFPFVIMADSLAESKINTYLQVKFYGKILLNSDYSIPEICEQKEPYNWSHGIENDLFSLSIILHNKNYFETFPLSHYDEHHLVFDLKTGNIIAIKDLFLKEKWELATEIFAKKTIEKLHENEKILDSIRYKIDIDNNDYGITHEDFKVVFFELPIEPTLILNYPPQNSYSFDVVDGKLHIFDINGLVNKKIFSLLPNHGWYDLEFTYDEIKDYLSEYGKSIIKTSRGNYIKNGIDGKLVKGTIGNYKIHGIIENKTEYIDQYNKGIRIYYWYDKHKEIISIYGKKDENKIDLTEKDENEPNNIRANFELELINNNKQLIGKWKDFKTKKELPVNLEIY